MIFELFGYDFEGRGEHARTIWADWRCMRGEWRNRSKFQAVMSCLWANPAGYKRIVPLFWRPVKREDIPTEEK